MEPAGGAIAAGRVLELATLFSLENLARAVDTFPHMTAMMKIEQPPHTYLEVRAIGAGIQNVLFADPRTVADVRKCVCAVRAETPATGGIHGVGMRRDVGYAVDVGSPAFVQALEDAVVAVMIEKAPAVEHLEAMLSVKRRGHGAVRPRRLLHKHRHPGQWDHPRVKEAEALVIKTALRLGVAPRVEIDTPDQAKPYLDMGVKHFCMGRDVGILFDWFKGNGAKLRAMMGG
jgi:2-keto-3-deoxy-L-rhamnonate aldolase RhmA